MRRIESRSDGNLAFDSDFIKVRSTIVILQSSLFLRILSFKAFKDVGSQAGGIAGAVGSISVRGQRMERSNNEGQRSLSVVNCCPFITWLESNCWVSLLSFVVNEGILGNFRQKLNLANLTLFLSFYLGLSPLFCNLVDAPLCLLKLSLSLSEALPLCRHILLVGR